MTNIFKITSHLNDREILIDKYKTIQYIFVNQNISHDKMRNCAYQLTDMFNILFVSYNGTMNDLKYDDKVDNDRVIHTIDLISHGADTYYDLVVNFANKVNDVKMFMHFNNQKMGLQYTKISDMVYNINNFTLVTQINPRGCVYGKDIEISYTSNNCIEPLTIMCHCAYYTSVTKMMSMCRNRYDEPFINLDRYV